MSDPTTHCAAEAAQRLGRDDGTLKAIFLTGRQLTDADVGELVDCLLAHPDIVKLVALAFNRLTDETGVKLARYLAASSTVEALSLNSNQFGEATYAAVAEALRLNTSLQSLYLYENQAVEQTSVDAAFVEALRLNPDRPARSDWWLYSADWAAADFKRLTTAADQLGHPSLQTLLLMRCH